MQYKLMVIVLNERNGLLARLVARILGYGYYAQATSLVIVSLFKIRCHDTKCLPICCLPMHLLVRQKLVYDVQQSHDGRDVIIP